MSELENLKERFIQTLEKIERNPNIDADSLDVWDIVVSTLSSIEEPYILTLKADLFIIKKIAEGFSTYSIALILGIPEKNVIDVGKIWGLKPVTTTLDFSPLYIYDEGMTALELVSEINTILPIPIEEKEAEKLIYNIERYYELLKFLREEERK